MQPVWGGGVREFPLFASNERAVLLVVLLLPGQGRTAGLEDSFRGVTGVGKGGIGSQYVTTLSKRRELM